MADQKKPRKVKFAPKAPPPRKKAQTVKPKTEANEDGDAEAAAQTQLLLRRFDENFRRQGARDQNTSSVQVAFGPGSSSSASIRTYNVPKEETNGLSSGYKLRSGSAKAQTPSQPLIAETDAVDVLLEDGTDDFPQTTKKEYREPWDYHRTYYPTTLPLRRPNSGNPEILDEAEFGEAARSIEYDEGTINPASDLDLLDKNEKGRMLFFQLPTKLPLIKRSASAKGKEIVGSSKSQSASASERGCSLEDLPGGYMGKLQVYKSGKVKLKLEEILYDVSPASDCVFAQDVAAINTAKRHCCSLSELGKRAVVTPDIDALLDSVIDLG